MWRDQAVQTCKADHVLENVSELFNLLVIHRSYFLWQSKELTSSLLDTGDWTAPAKLIMNTWISL